MTNSFTQQKRTLALCKFSRLLISLSTKVWVQTNYILVLALNAVTKVKAMP